MAQETFKKIEDLGSDEKLEVIKDTEKSYLSYIFLRQSGNQHNKLKVDLQN